MARRFREEFYCNECNKYFITYLREDMYGAYTIECPNPKCKHHHYRMIKEGICTSDRHTREYGDGKSELILGLPSTLRNTPWHDDPDFRRSLMIVRWLVHIIGGYNGSIAYRQLKSWMGYNK